MSAAVMRNWATIQPSGGKVKDQGSGVLRRRCFRYSHSAGRDTLPIQLTTAEVPRGGRRMSRDHQPQVFRLFSFGTLGRRAPWNIAAVRFGQRVISPTPTFREEGQANDEKRKESSR
jgi:hypothetical protein